ncbi:MAG: hypothetical protein ACM31C_27330 [Acidobacteriota bacterium]
MKHAIVGLIVGGALVLGLGCSKSSEQQAKEDMEKQAKAHPDDDKPAAPPPEHKGPPAPEAKPKEAPPPDPTNAADLDKAFKQAMIDGRDKDVLHYCDMLKLDDKSNIQSIMGCTLSACRTKDADTAKKYVSLLPGTKDGNALRDQAKKICSTSGVAL